MRRLRTKLAVTGIVAGALAGLFGVGGGVVIVPLLGLWFGWDQRKAVATSFIALAPLAVVAAIGYALHGDVDLYLAVPLAAGSMIGAWLGAALLNRMPLSVLRGIFAVIALLGAARLLTSPGAPSSLPDHQWWHLALLVPVGVLVGVIAALTGIGGGTIMVPVMQLGFGASAVLAKGTSLATIIPTSLLGGYRNIKLGNGSLPDALWIGGFGVLTSFPFSQISVGLPPTLADIMFGCLLLFAAGRTVWGDLRNLVRKRESLTP
ncbi:sulfite exporter TauE/SafE family protein [Pseudonocardiaceae bacterium YIM PH 21723]|nr:sulfite exporter TauE/SafE family protein [Pseudonocardiaceae bacterium YIM PH 21723]